jgi:hypothetical protein
VNTVLSQIFQSVFYPLNNPTCQRDSQNDNRGLVQTCPESFVPQDKLREGTTSENWLITEMETVPKGERKEVR